MMNNARLHVGLQGVGVANAQRNTRWLMPLSANRAGHQVRGKDDNEAVAIINHPDVRRMLMSMRTMTKRRAAYAMKMR